MIMISNNLSLQEGSSLRNEPPADKAGAYSTSCRDLSSDAVDGRTSENPKLPSHARASRISIVGPTRPRNFTDQFRSPSSPLSGCGQDVSSLLSPSGHGQSQLHRRNNRQSGSQSRKENIPPRLPCKTFTAKARRSALADDTTPQGRSESFEDVPFAGSTSIHSPSRKIDNGDPGAAGLKFELEPKPFLAKSDSQETVTAHNSFVPISIEPVDRPTEFLPESTHPTPSTPLREALASFNDMFSPTFTFPAKRSTPGKGIPNDTFHLSFRLPASPIPTGVSISTAFNMSTLADSISQLTGDIAASITARCENDYLYEGQYREDAVAHDERFDWEEEMRCLEIQCGPCGETK